jgi:transcriptional regulator with XRE-family HTH domain/tetratricopeptide (TPR) repeat protein
MRKRWSVAVASERAGVSVNTFNRWERGLQVPQLSTLDQVCRAFDMSPEELGFEHAIEIKRRAPLYDKAEIDLSTGDILSTSTAGNAALPIEQPTRELPVSAEQAKRSLEIMSQVDRKRGGDGFSRRQAITTLIGAPLTVFGLAQGTRASVLHPDETLSLCKISIPLLWRLYFEGGLAEVTQSLPGYLAQLTKLAQEPSHYQKRAASLASQGYQLGSLISTQHQNFGAAMTYATQAFTYAQLVEDAHLQTAALIRRALVTFYLKRPYQRVQAYEQALFHSSKASPLLQGRVHIGLAEAYSALGKERESDQHLDLAHKIFPASYEDDPNFAYTHFNCSSLHSLEGLKHLNLQQPQKAWISFTYIDGQIPRTPVPDRIELTVRQALAACELNEREQSCAYLGTAVRNTLAAGNHLRYDEAYAVYQHMERKWSKEPQVKALAQLFV